MKSYNVLIIGAGKIGALFDTPETNYVLTHAHAFINHIGFNLLGFVDSQFQRAEKAAIIWNVTAFSSLKDAFAKSNVDIVVVAVSDEYHYSVLKELANYQMKLVFCEKPLTKTVDEANEIINLYKEKNISLNINYSRRFVPAFSALKIKITSGNFGKFLSGSGYYGKGVLHNGSHMIDLLLYFFGNIKEAYPISVVYDYFEDDPTYSAVLLLEPEGKFYMHGIDCRHYSIFELDLFFEKQRVRILESGFRIEYYDIGDSAVYKGYRDLKRFENLDTQLLNSLTYASDAIYKFLNTGSPCPSPGYEGILSQKVCSKIINGKLRNL